MYDKMNKEKLYENIYKENFSFGKNWQNFLKKLDNKKIETAKQYLITFMWWKENIQWKTIIDFWSWSWLMSLCFYLLWAKKIISVDIDENSIHCTEKLKEKYYKNHGEWKIIKWSILDKKIINDLWTFDIVYSRWVIHHSWNMWKWLDNILDLVKSKWLLYISIYNESKSRLKWTSKFRLQIKKIYSTNKFMRPLIKTTYITYFIIWLILHLKNPLIYIKNYKKNSMRWMDFFVDIEDRLGWYPYEYASFEKIKEHYEKKWLELINRKKVKNIGCNEFLFKK